MPAAPRYWREITISVTAAQGLFMYRLRPFFGSARSKKSSPPKWRAEKPEKGEAPNGAAHQGSELELGLDQTAEGTQAIGILSGERLAQVGDRRGDADVVGHLELVEQFISESGFLFTIFLVGFSNPSGLTNSKSEGVAIQEDVVPLKADIPGIGVGIIAAAFVINPGAAVATADGRNPTGLLRGPPSTQAE